MNPLEFYREKLTVPINDDTVILTYYVKKVSATRVHVVIENNIEGLKINGKEGSFEITTEAKDIRYKLFFTFDASDFEEYKQIREKSSESSDAFSYKISPEQSFVAPSNKNSSKLYEIMSNKKYYDVILVSSDSINIPSHRNVLSKYSPIFEKIFDEASELPVTINVENFNVETIQAALNFLYDKYDALDGKEPTDACCSVLVKSVDPSNVCELIQIAYLHNFEELKKKCLKMLVENKHEIEASKAEKLPKNILVDIFLYDPIH
uniref:BTB domain-containing protein n=1 Tax=Panagrolaimus sp. ES5 TaxID=591445 RepID=A0AC34F2N9_9BILA